MSPVESMSPTSLPPTPTTPLGPETVKATSEFRTTPTSSRTPTISPALHLPRLITSFNPSSTIDHIRRSSTQFQLPTPSPLTLRQSPQTAIATLQQQQSSSSSPTIRARRVRRHREREQTDASNGVTHAVIIQSLTSHGSSRLVRPRAAYIDDSDAHQDLPAISPTVRSRLPSLKRNVAMEGPGHDDVHMNSPIIKQIVQLPLRVSTGSSTTTTTTTPTTTTSTASPGKFSSPNTASGQKAESPTFSSSSSSSSSAILVPTDSSHHSSPRRRCRASLRRSPIYKHKHEDAHTHTRTYRRRRRYSSIHRRLRALPPIDHTTQLIIRSDAPPAPPPNAQFTAHLTHLATPLVPLVSVRTGRAHPHFPTSLLQYHLMTHDQLDSLARWYHQTHDAGAESTMYPAPLGRAKVWTSSVTPPPGSALAQVEGRDASGEIVPLSVKRRRWGRFMGLRQCESPTDEDGDGDGSEHGDDGEDGPDSEGESESEPEQRENLEQRMEKEWQRAMKRAEEDKAMQQKMWRGRF